MHATQGRGAPAGVLPGRNSAYEDSMLFDGFWLPLVIKLAATVAVVIGATLLAERGGPFWGGLMCAFPLSSGPAVSG